MLNGQQLELLEVEGLVQETQPQPKMKEEDADQSLSLLALKVRNDQTPCLPISFFDTHYRHDTNI
jgi:hypothetical protein